MWCFNRLRDVSKIPTERLHWQGPFSWPGFEDSNINPLPDVEAIYLFVFDYKDGYVLYAAGITNSVKRRLAQHTREYKKGNYNILNIAKARKGERVEVWHGWNYAKEHRDEFEQRKEQLSQAILRQLRAFRIFIAEVNDVRKRKAIEYAIKEFQTHYKCDNWKDVADSYSTE